MSASEQPDPRPQGAAQASPHAGVFHTGFGDKLRRGREALGLAVLDVSAKLKLSERQVEAMEKEDFAQLPDEVFCRGFVRNYARLVKLDPGELIIPVDIHAAAAETITAPSEGVIFASPGLRRWVLLPLLALAFFILLVALLYYWLRQGENTLVGESAVPAAVAPPLSRPIPQPAVPLPVAPLPQAAVPAPVAPADAPVPTPPAAQAAATPTTNPAGKAHTLRFAPSLDAWIQVVDGAGNRYSKLVRAGTVEVFAGEAPFKLVVGEAAQVQLTYDGHRIDLTPFIGQKVARLTLE